MHVFPVSPLREPDCVYPQLPEVYSLYEALQKEEQANLPEQLPEYLFLPPQSVFSVFPADPEKYHILFRFLK